MFRNLTLKILSVIVALLLVAFVNSDSNTSQIGMLVPIELVNIPKDQMVVSPLTPQAQLVIKGPKFLISQVPLSPPSIQVRLPNDLPENYVVSLEDQFVDLPWSVQLVAIEPPEMEFRFESIVAKDLPVVVPQIGFLSEDLLLSASQLTPDRVRVTGPGSELKKVNQVLSEPIDLREVAESSSRELKLRTPGPLFRLGSSSVTYSIEVAPRRVERKFDKIPVQLAKDGQYVTLTGGPVVTVELSGPPSRLKELRREQIIPFVAAADSATPQPVQVSLPDGVAVVSVAPNEVKITAKQLNASAKQVKR